MASIGTFATSILTLNLLMYYNYLLDHPRRPWNCFTFKQVQGPSASLGGAIRGLIRFRRLLRTAPFARCVGPEKDEAHALWNPQPRSSRLIDDEDDSSAYAGRCFAREGCEQLLEDRLRHAVAHIPEARACRGRDEGGGVEAVETMVSSVIGRSPPGTSFILLERQAKKSLARREPARQSRIGTFVQVNDNVNAARQNRQYREIEGANVASTNGVAFVCIGDHFSSHATQNQTAAIL